MNRYHNTAPQLPLLAEMRLPSPVRVLLLGKSNSDRDNLATVLQGLAAPRCIAEQSHQHERALRDIQAGRYDIVLCHEHISSHVSAMDFLSLLVSTRDAPPLLVLTESSQLGGNASFVFAGANEALPEELATPEALSRSITHTLLRHRQLQTLRKRADHDFLTQALNANTWQEEALAFQGKYTSQGNLVIVTVKVNGLTELNQENGMLFGDRTLVQVADILRRNAGPDSAVGRISGNSFAIIAKPDSAENYISTFEKQLNAQLSSDTKISIGHHPWSEGLSLKETTQLAFNASLKK